VSKALAKDLLMRMNDRTFAKANVAVMLAQKRFGNTFIKICKLILTNIARSLQFCPGLNYFCIFCGESGLVCKLVNRSVAGIWRSGKIMSISSSSPALYALA
jgi:hypothetical protein